MNAKISMTDRLRLHFPGGRLTDLPCNSGELPLNQDCNWAIRTPRKITRIVLPREANSWAALNVANNATLEFERGP